MGTSAEAAIDPHNINLLYITRSTIEQAVNENPTFKDLNRYISSGFIRLKLHRSDPACHLSKSGYQVTQALGIRSGESGRELLLAVKKICPSENEMYSHDLRRTEIPLAELSSESIARCEVKLLERCFNGNLFEPLTILSVRDRYRLLQCKAISFEDQLVKLEDLRDKANELGKTIRKKELSDAILYMQESIDKDIASHVLKRYLDA